MRYVVLLKNGILEIEACATEAVFSLASSRDAGICGVFAGYKEAEAFIAEINSPQHQLRLSASGAGLPTATRY